VRAEIPKTELARLIRPRSRGAGLRLLRHCVLHFRDQLLERERLGQELELAAVRQALGERLLGIARYKDDPQLRAALAQFLEQRGAVHLGHDDVGHDEIDLAWVPLEHLDRLDAVAGLEHAVAARRKPARVEAAQTLLVLDKQDRALTGIVGQGGRSAVRGGGSRRDQVVRRRSIARQEDPKRRSATDLRLRINETAGLLDDAIDRREAEPGSLADLLGREKRLENAIDDLRSDSAAGVRNLDQHVIAGRQAPAFELHRVRLGNLYA